jgi:predicted nucleotidyltransferase
MSGNMFLQFKNMKAGFRKRKEKDDTPELPRVKKPRIEQTPNIEVLDLGDWLRRTEKVCHRAGELRKYLDVYKQRMLRRMETFEEDQILTDIQPMWEEKLPCG